MSMLVVINSKIVHRFIAVMARVTLGLKKKKKLCWAHNDIQLSKLCKAIVNVYFCRSESNSK